MSSLAELFQKADELKTKISRAMPLPEEMQKRLDQYFKIQFTYSSNFLAGSSRTRSETKLLLEQGLSQDQALWRDCYAVLGTGDAYDFILDISRQDHLQITEEILKNLHIFLAQNAERNMAGVYRHTQVTIPDSEFTPPLPEDLAHLMEHFIMQIEISKNLFHPVELAITAHKRVVDIQPFNSGNEKVAQLLMNLMLLNTGYGVVIIPPSLKENYTDSLSLSQIKYDTEPLVKLVTECLIQTQQEYYRLMNSEQI